MAGEEKPKRFEISLKESVVLLSRQHDASNVIRSKYSCGVIKDKKENDDELTLKFVDERLLAMPSVALMQTKKEIDYMFSLVEENMNLCFEAMENSDLTKGEAIAANESVIDFTNSALTKFLVKLSATVEQSDEVVIGSYFHVLNDLERVGDHAENFYEIVAGMKAKGISFSDMAKADIKTMREKTMQMLVISKDAFDNLNKDELPALASLEDEIDEMKREFTANHFSRLAEGNCSIEVSPYYSSTIVGLERVADHLVNIGYSIVNPIGSQRDI